MQGLGDSQKISKMSQFHGERQYIGADPLSIVYIYQCNGFEILDNTPTNWRQSFSFAFSMRTEVMDTRQQSSLRLEAMESQALLLQHRLSESDKTSIIKRSSMEPHWSYFRFQREQQKAVRWILADIGPRAAEEDEAFSA
jgi:hypothetical protein